MIPEEVSKMSTVSDTETHRYESEVEIFQMRFKDSDGGDTYLSAWELAASIEGVAGFAEQLAKKGVFGEGIKPEVQVRPMKEGSFVVDFVIPALAEHALDAIPVAVGAAGMLFYDQIKAGINNIKGIPVADFDLVSDDFIKVTWKDGEATQVHKDVWDEFQNMKKRTRRNLEKIIAPLSSSADTVEFRGGSPSEDAKEIMESKPIAAVTSKEYQEVVSAPQEVQEYDREFIAEAKFESVDFRPGGKCRIASTAGRRMVTIEDDNFQSLLDSGLKIGKDDLYEVTIKETVTVKSGRSTTSWVLTNIRRTKKGDGEALN